MMDEMERMDGMSLDTEKTERDKLKAVFPECFSEGKLDIDKLLTMCGEYITNDFEKYKFEWKGKSESLILAQKRSTGTLRPKVEESVNFDETQNLYIKGDNLEVIKLLQTSYYNKVKMIYIDPPYNTGHDFVYEDDFTDPIERYKFVTSQATRSNPETMGRFHTAWLNMMYPRLRLAATLLREDGVCFISIDDTEVHNLRKLCDETFGEENFVAEMPWKGRGGRQDSKHYAVVHEYILCYAKNLSEYVAGEEIKEKESFPKYDENVKRNYKTQLLRKWGSNSKQSDRPNLFYSILAPDNTELFPMLSDVEKGCWRWGHSRMNEEMDRGTVEFVQSNNKWVAYEKIYEPLEGESGTKKYNTWLDTISNGTDEIKCLFGEKMFSYPKSIELISKFMKMANCKEDDIVLDFFSGSATTAHAVMQLNAEDGGNRQFIMVQLPEVCDEKSEACKAGYQNICDIGMERIRRAGTKILAEQESQLEIGEEEKPPLDIGFKVFELDTSNLKAWDGTPIKDEEQQVLFERMNAMFDNVKSDRSDMDMVYEVMLKMGIPLTYPILPLDINGKIAYSIGEECLLLVCLAEGVTPEDIIEMCEHAPAKLVLGRNCMKDDSTMSNAYYIMKDREIAWKLI